MFFNHVAAMNAFKEIIKEGEGVVDLFEEKAVTDQQVQIANTIKLLVAVSDVLRTDVQRFSDQFKSYDLVKLSEAAKGNDMLREFIANVYLFLEYNETFDGYTEKLKQTMEGGSRAKDSNEEI